MSENDPSASVKDELRKAHQALDDAEKARSAELSDATIVNRLYYAAFHAVQAALYDRGFEPTTHGGVLSLFGSEIIATGDAERKDGRFFSKLGQLRQQADYSYEELDENADALYARTKQLVSEMEALCDTTP